jgi:hypothetical protein
LIVRASYAHPPLAALASINFSSQHDLMPKIMIRCPIVGSNVSTGLTTETILFDSIPDDLEIPLRCPACLKIHNWRPKHAWVDRKNTAERA